MGISGKDYYSLKTSQDSNWYDASWRIAEGCNYSYCPMYSKCHNKRTLREPRKVKFYSDRLVWESEYTSVYIAPTSDLTCWQDNWIVQTFDEILNHRDKFFFVMSKDYTLRERVENLTFVPDNIYWIASMTNKKDYRRYRKRSSKVPFDILLFEPYLEKVHLDPSDLGCELNIIMYSDNTSGKYVKLDWFDIDIIKLYGIGGDIFFHKTVYKKFPYISKYQTPQDLREMIVYSEDFKRFV